MEFLVLFILLTALYFVFNQYNKNTKGYEKQFFITYIDGIPGLNKGIDTNLYIYSDKITFDDKQTIPLSRIKKTEVVSEKQITEKHKSVIKRAIGAGILLGPLGALVGGMSGIGTKQVEETVYFLSIDYINKDNIECTALFMMRKTYKMIIEHISKEINNKIGYVPVQDNKGSYEI